MIFTFYISLYAQDTDKEEKELLVAKKAFADGFWEVAISLLERFLKNYPASEKQTEVNLLIGQCYFQQNKFLDALKKFAELLNAPSADKLKDTLFYWIAETHFKSNAFAKSAQYYKLLIDDFPQSSYIPQAYYSLGWCLFQEARFSEALEYFKSVEEKFSQTPQSTTQDVSFKIIECLYNLKDYNGLKDKVGSYLKSYPKDVGRLPYLYFYSAEADYYLNNFEAAMEEYTKVISSTGDEKILALAKLGRGWVNLKLKKYKQAEEAFSEIKTDDPATLFQVYLGKADALYGLAEYKEARGDAYQDPGDYHKAIQAYENILKDYPDSLYSDYVYYQLGLSLIKTGNYASSREIFARFPIDFKDSNLRPQAMYLLGVSLYNLANFGEAMKVFKDIIRMYSQDTELLQKAEYELANCYSQMGNEEEALTRFKALRSKYPDSKLTAEVMWWLGEYYYRHDDLNLARRYLSSVIKDFPKSNWVTSGTAAIVLADVQFKLAELKEQTGKTQEAIEEYLKVTEQYPENNNLAIKSLLRVAKLYEDKDNFKEAINIYERIITLDVPEAKYAQERIDWINATAENADKKLRRGADK